MCSPFRRRQRAKYGACYPLWYRRCTLEHFCDGIPAHMSHSGSGVDCGCLCTFLLVTGVSLPHTTTDWQMRTRTMPRWLYAIWVAVLSQEPAEAQSRWGYVHTPRQQLLYLPGHHCSILWHAIAWQHCSTDLFGGCSGVLLSHTAPRKHMLPASIVHLRDIANLQAPPFNNSGRAGDVLVHTHGWCLSEELRRQRCTACWLAR